MFQVTRLAASMTKLTRSTVKNVANNKIDLKNASRSFKNMAQTEIEKNPYSKNIFKRVFVWIKEFVNNYKDINSRIKTPVKNLKKALGNTFTKKHQKNVANMIFENIKNSGSKLKKELKQLLTRTNQ